MLENLKAQWSSSTFGLLAFVGWFAWTGIHSGQINKALLADFSRQNLEQMTFDHCDSLSYRVGDVFPALCKPAIQQISAGPAHQYTGRNFGHKGAGFVFLRR